jgi:hypothetical protein
LPKPVVKDSPDTDMKDLLHALAQTIQQKPAAFQQVRAKSQRRGLRLPKRPDVGRADAFPQLMFDALQAAHTHNQLRALLIDLRDARLLTADSEQPIADIFDLLPPVEESSEAQPEVPSDDEDNVALSGAFTGSLAALNFAPPQEPAVQLQAAVDGSRPFQDAGLASRKELSAMVRVCHIAIDGRHKGTGVLLRPTLVATAGHVVRGLIDPTVMPPKNLADFSKLALPGSVKRLTITFGDMMEVDGDPFAGVATRPVRPASELHEEWLAYYSPPAPIELMQGFDICSVQDIAEPDGPWDLAILRLARPPGMNDAGHPLAKEPTANQPAPISILSHPKSGSEAQPLQKSTGMIGQFAAHRLRILHNARTLGGSSGAPCFNDNWEIVALHQAGDVNKNVNRAVPVEPWKAQLDGILRAVDRFVYIPDVPSLEGGARHPVFGRRQAQQRIDRAISPGASAADRLIIVRGKTGRGKTFTSRLIEAKQIAGQPQIAFNLGSLATKDVWNLYAALMKAIGASTADQSPLLTSDDRVALKLASQLVSALNKGAGPEGLWLILDGFEMPGMQDDPAILQLVDGLITELEHFPSLRVALLGWPQPVLPAFAASVEDLDLPSAALRGRDLVDYLVLRGAPAGVEIPPKLISDATLALDAMIAMINWESAPPDYYQQVLNTVGNYLELILANASKVRDQ